MPVTREELEAAIRETIQVTHVEVEDNSSGCGENFSVLIVSKVNHELLGRHRSVKFVFTGIRGKDNTRSTQNG